jgi:hypothetical protein
MDPRSFYGLVFHEWAGLIIGLFFIFHKALNWTWIKKVTVGFFKGSPGRARLNYVLDILLLAGMILMILSGIAIAHAIDFSWLNLGGSRMFWRLMHTSSSLITLALFGVHLGLHWKWVLQRFRIRKINKKHKKISITIVSLLIILAGVFAFNKLQYWDRSARIFKLNSKQLFGRDFGRHSGDFESRNRRDRSDNPGERTARPEFRNVPDSLREGRSRSFSREGSDSRERNFERSIQRRGNHRQGKDIQLRTVVWFLAVFAAFTVLTNYLDIVVKKVWRKKKQQ